MMRGGGEPSGKTGGRRPWGNARGEGEEACRKTCPFPSPLAI